MEELDFETLWRQHADRVLHFCHRFTHSAEAAEEVCHRVAIRIWRHYASLRDRNPFSSWVWTITRRECARWWRQQRVAQERAAPLLPSVDVADGRLVPPIDEPDQPPSLSLFIDEAILTGHISAPEGAVIKARLASGDVPWTQISASLGIEASHAAVLHCRAIPKLRVFLLLHHPEICGGIDTLRAAFENARITSPPMTEGEVLAFEYFILKRQTRYSAPQGKAELRSACARVARFLPGPFF